MSDSARFCVCNVYDDDVDDEDNSCDDSQPERVGELRPTLGHPVLFSGIMYKFFIW